MHKGLVVKKSAGQVVPEAALTQFLKNYPSCFGIAVVLQNEAKKPQVVTSSQPSPVDLATVMELQTEHKDRNVIMFFGNYPEGVVNEDDVQPFSILEGAELVGFFAGDYPGFHKEGSTHTDAWFAVTEDLWPTMKETFIDVCDRNIVKLMATCKTPIIKRHLTNMIVGSGSITLFAENDEIIEFPKNEGDIIPYSWGTTTDACGYVEAAAAASVPAAGRKLFLSPGNKKSAPAASPAPAAKPAEPAPGPAAAPAEPPPAAATAVANQAASDAPTLPDECAFVGIAPDGSILVKPKDMSGDKNHKKKFYMKFCGYIPEGSKKGVAAPLKKEWLTGVVKDFKDLKASQQPAVVVAEKPVAVPDQKLNTPAQRVLTGGRKIYSNVKKAVLPEPPKVEVKEYPASDLPKKDVAPHFVPDEVVMPFVSDTEKAALTQFIKTIDQDSSEIIDPAEFQDFESRCPNFTDLTGKNFTEISKWSDKKIAEFITNCPETTKVLLRNLCASNIGLHRSLEMLGRALTKTQAAQEKQSAAA